MLGCSELEIPCPVPMIFSVELGIGMVRSWVGSTRRRVENQCGREGGEGVTLPTHKNHQKRKKKRHWQHIIVM